MVPVVLPLTRSILAAIWRGKAVLTGHLASGAPFEVPAVRLIPLPTEVSSWGEPRHSHKANATWIRSLGFLYVLTE
jgi:hypothetical protein